MPVCRQHISFFYFLENKNWQKSGGGRLGGNVLDTRWNGLGDSGFKLYHIVILFNEIGLSGVFSQEYTSSMTCTSIHSIYAPIMGNHIGCMPTLIANLIEKSDQMIPNFAMNTDNNNTNKNESVSKNLLHLSLFLWVSGLTLC